MAIFVPNPERESVEELIEELSRYISSRYRDAEDTLIREVAERAIRDMNLADQLPTAPAGGTLTVADRRRQNRILAELAGHRAKAFRDLQLTAMRIVSELKPREMSQFVIGLAAREGEAAAAAWLGFAERQAQTVVPLTFLGSPVAISAVSLTGSAAQAVAQVALSLESRLTVLNQRLTRYPQDAYQRIIALHSPNTLLGVTTSRIQQASAVQRFLAEGIPGFLDRGGRNWTIGAYAEMAGRTTVNRAFNDAGVWRMQQSGINLVTVVRGLDSCRKCAEWAGKILSTDGTPAGPRILSHATADQTVAVDVAGTVEEARAAGWNHPNCFPSFVPVGAPTGVVGADSRWYEGEIIVINTTSGRELTVTPNHPVLTDHGWVAAGALKQGDNLVSYHGDVEGMPVGNPDHQRSETRIGEVFQTLRESSSVASVTVPGAAEQFHGDGVLDSDVDVVLADRLLGSNGEPLSSEELGEIEFLFGGVRQGALLPESALGEVLAGSLHALHGLVGGTGELGAILGAGAAHANVHGGGAVAEFDFLALEQASEGVTADPSVGGELLDALSGLVSLDEIRDVERREFHGHVYNLESGGGWYTANSIVVHNCRCRLVAYSPGLTVPQEDTTYDEDAEKERAKQRSLEREIRSAKRREASAMTDTDRRRAAQDVKDAQGDMRSFLGETGRLRSSWREQLHFADGR